MPRSPLHSASALQALKTLHTYACMCTDPPSFYSVVEEALVGSSTLLWRVHIEVYLDDWPDDNMPLTISSTHVWLVQLPHS